MHQTKSSRNSSLSVLLFCLLIGACNQNEESSSVDNQATSGSEQHIRAASNVSDLQLVASGADRRDWLTYGGSYNEDRYSELDQINPENLDQLGLAWTLDLGTKRGIQATPIVVDGIMYLSGPWSVVWAIDVRKGELIWKYDPEVPKSMSRKLCCGVMNRGVALYQGAVYVGTLDGRLVSIDAIKGTKIWETNTVPENSFYSITGAPRIVKGRVLIGNGGAEFNARGYVTAYDAKTGEQAWRFYTVPGDPSKPFEHADLADAAKTWNGEWWKQGGGGTAWDAIVYDPELNMVYIGVGNGTHWNREIRSPGGGDNLYLSSIVALNADSGEYVWHFQTTPGDSWDYTATQHIILAELEVEGKSRKVLMQAPKNGFFYVLDRITGEFISGDNFVYMNWASGLDENGRPIETPNARYKDGKVHWMSPSSHGGHNWPPMSYNHKTGLVYIPTASQSEPYVYNPEVGHNSPDGLSGKIGANLSLANKTYVEMVFDANPLAPIPGTVKGHLIAYDPIKQEQVWSVEQPYHFNGGLLSTSTGLLMQGDAQGMFSIRDTATGDVLWSYDIRAGAMAPPITYMVDGEQYITMAVGWGAIQGLIGKRFDRLHPGSLYTWKLGGTATPPEKLPALEKPFTELTQELDELVIGRGFDNFISNCTGCHALGEGGGSAPDLTRSSDGILNIFQQIVREGALEVNGMPNFVNVLSEQEVEDLKSFILYSASEFKKGVKPSDPAYQQKLGLWQYQADVEKAKAKQAAEQ